VGGNGGYTFADQSATPYLFSGVKGGPGEAMHDLLVRSKPEVHKRSMKRPIMETSEFCAACHKVSLQEPVNDYRWLRGQQDYDSWHDSGVARNNPRTFYLPDEARSCRDCHMPLVAAPLGDVSAKDGKVRDHRFPGINTALPAIRGDDAMIRYTEDFLRDGTMRVDLFVMGEDGKPVGPVGADLRPVHLTAGDEVELLVVVRNLGVGHIFPAGTLDSNEGWLAVEVAEKDGEPLFRSGWLEGDRSLSGEAHTYGATIIDRESRRIDRRNAKDIYVNAQTNVVPPGTADLGRYRFRIPEKTFGESLRLRATLRFRKFRPDYTAFSFEGREPPALPVTDIASAVGDIDCGADFNANGGFSYPDPHWTRWNDLGIAALRQGDTRLASLAFAEVDRLATTLPDGPRNLARVKVSEGLFDEALPHLEEAEERAPGDARTAYWFGAALSRLGRYDPALEAFERVLRDFPEDRNTLREIGEVFYRTGNFEESLRWWLRVLEIDPEDADAHHHRQKCYQGLGREADAAEAEKAFLRYKVDEDAPQRTNAFLRAHPDVNREAQKVHVHELHPAR
jgi:tetratricopeptide (TPR) repeat protein